LGSAAALATLQRRIFQDWLSKFDEQQQKLDEMLDKKLSICRC
jgi:hypothetical protein